MSVFWIFNTLCYAVGVYTALMILFELGYAVYVAITPAFDLYKRYGKGSWAVVTGASDGIGEGFCYELAKDGFNICLVSRSLDKLKRVQEKVKQVNSKVETKIVVADFKKSAQVGFFDDVVSQMGDIDVGILVNNVGMKNLGNFQQLQVEAIVDEVVVNTFPMIVLSRRMIPRMLERDNMSGIINVSSVRALVPFARMLGYSGTKKFNDFLSRGLSYQFQDKIDIMSLRPMYVTSQMTHQIKGPHVITPVECARGAMNKLGIARATNGHWKHRVQSYFVERIPSWVVRFLQARRTKKLMQNGKQKSQ